MVCTLDGFGVSAMGISGRLSPEELCPLLEEMRSWTDKPLIVRLCSDRCARDAAEFARQMERLREQGVSILGGVGCAPEFVQRLAQLPPIEEPERPSKRQGVCSASHMTEFAGVQIIGACIDPDGSGTTSARTSGAGF